jgi:AbiV family abortive infection protein
MNVLEGFAMLSTRSIVLGAYYAMEQSGRLLIDATRLYEGRRWSSSLVLAVFSLEELGKADMLLMRAINAAKNGPKAIETVMAGLTRHTTKLKSGRGPLTVTASVGFWGEVPEPNTEEMAELHQRLAAADRIALEHAPREAHEARMRALYVDLGNYDLCSRPVETSRDDAYDISTVVMNLVYGYWDNGKGFTFTLETRLIERRSRLPTGHIG